MAIDENTPVIEVVKSPSGAEVQDKGMPADAEAAIISNINQAGTVQVDDVTATREVVSPVSLPLDYQYNEKQMMANVSTAISADIEDMTERELLEDETFGYASKKMYRAFRGEDFKGTDEEATQFGIDLMRRVENNLVELGDFSYKVQDMSEDDAKIALYMMDMFEAKEFTGRGFAEALGYMGLDPTTYIGLGTFGYGFAGKEAAKAATKQGMKAALQRIAYSSASVGAIEGGVYTGAFEHGKQVVSEAAGEGYDSGSVGLNMAIGAGFGAAAGKYLPEIFDYAGEKVAKWSAAKNFKAEVRAAADAGDPDAVQVLADMELLDNHFDSDGFMRRKLDEFEQTRVGQMVTGIQRIVPENRKSVDEIISDAAALNDKQRKQKLSAAMRDASPEDKQKLIAEMKATATPPKPKSEKAKEVIMEQEEFNASFYSKLEHEANKIPDDMEFENPAAVVEYLKSQGVKTDEINAALSAGVNMPLEGKYKGSDVKGFLKSRGDKITKRTYDDSSESEALEVNDWMDEWVTIDEQAQNINTGDGGWGARITDDYTGMDREIGVQYNDEVYVDDSGYEYGYEEMLDDWYENYYDGEEYTQEMIDSGVDMDDADEVAKNVKALASDDGLHYDYYGSKIEYINESGDVFETMQEAIDDEMFYMHENYTQAVGENGAETFEQYTVDGGDDYRLEIYQMEDFEAPAGKQTAVEPHFGGLEFGADNVQVHARMKTREDANGNTGTVLEEVQSQWEQDWRKTGGGQKPPTEEQIAAANKKIDEVAKRKNAVLKEAEEKRNRIIEINQKRGEIRDSHREQTKAFNDRLKELSDLEDEELSKIDVEFDKLRAKNENGIATSEQIAAKNRNRVEVKKKYEKLSDELEDKQKKEGYNADPEYKKLGDEEVKLSNEKDKLERKARTIAAESAEADKVIRWKEPSIATPPIKNRTQYTKLAMLDNLLNSLENGENFFGWINGHIQNGGNIETTQGMSQAYDIEMPRIIQKATGETPYMASFYNGRPVSGEKVYWDSKNAQDLEFYKNIADDEINGEMWYWKIDYTDALKKKLKDAKIQMYGVGGVALIGANGADLEGDTDGEQ